MADVTRSILPSCGRQESLLRKFGELYPLTAERNALPRLIICFPAARMNKFQSLLYSRAQEFGFAVERISALDELNEINWPGPIVFHAHWLNILGRGATDLVQAEENFADAIGRLNQFRKSAGATTVWTAHNLIPHNDPCLDVARNLRTYVLENFDLIHLLEADHQVLIERAYGRTLSNTVVARHPHYATSYPNGVEYTDARERVGFEPGACVLLFFGSIQKYKGLKALVHAFRNAVARGRNDLRLVIAGIPSDRDYVAELCQLIGEDENILFSPSKVADENVQIFFTAANYSVLPYTDDPLNSGAAILSLSFDTPIVAPNAPAFRSLAPFGASLYEHHSDGLKQALFEIGESPVTTDYSGFTLRYNPTDSSRRFFRAVESVVAE